MQGLSRISFSRSDQSDVIGEGTLVFTETSGMETDTKLFRGTSTETTIEVFPIVSLLIVRAASNMELHGLCCLDSTEVAIYTHACTVWWSFLVLLHVCYGIIGVLR